MTEAASPAEVTVRALEAAEYEAALDDLGALIVDAVEGGSGVNFLTGVTVAEARAWWEERIPEVRRGTVTAFAALDGERIVGSTLLIRSRNPNSPHRAEIGKVIVLRSHRRRGIAAALMRAAEDRARDEDRWMLVLDTVTGSPADTFYRQLGWNETGTVPDYALSPDGQPWAATFFWKDLR